MLKRLNIRLYPTKKQEKVLNNHFNAYRFAYNLCLEYKSHLWKYHKVNKSGYDLQNELFTIIKEVEFLSKCKVECIRQAALDVDKNYKKFFEGNGFPKFKSKKDKQAFVANQSICIKKKKISFFKNLIKFKTSDRYFEKLKNYKIKQCSFFKDKTGKYWASCLIEDYGVNILPETQNKIGIDLGLKYFLVTSDGEYIKNKRFYIRSQFKLRRLKEDLVKLKKEVKIEKS